MANKSKHAAPKKQAVAEPTERTPKKFFVVQVAKMVDDKKDVATEYPETTTTEKALKIAIAKHTGVYGVQVTGSYKTAGDLIKSMQKA